MTTRAVLRQGLRQRLEDTGGDPLWDDDMLNETLTAAMRAYGLRIPREATAPLPVSAGATEVPVPGVAGEPGRVVRLLDPRGRVVPRTDGDPAAGLVAQSWRWWDGTLVLSQPAAGGTWRLEYLAPRAVPASDEEDVDIVHGDEELVIVLAMAAALSRRATEDAKRGIRGEMPALAEAARREAAGLFAARQRRVRGGWLAAG